MSFTPRVLLYQGTGVIGSLIQWQTRGVYSHAALLVNEDEVIESREFHGVRSRRADDLEKADQYLVLDMSAEGWMAAVAFARSQVGKRYDYLAIARFLTRSNGDERDSWFCSELVFAALLAGGVRPLERVEAWAVSPALLSMSPRLTPDFHKTFFPRVCSRHDPRVTRWRNKIVQP